jgi:hypothetical protein
MYLLAAGVTGTARRWGNAGGAHPIALVDVDGPGRGLAARVEPRQVVVVREDA